MKSILKIVSLFILVVFTSCKNDAKTEPEIKTIEVQKEKEVHTSEAIKAEFSNENSKALFADYIALKTAFVNTDANEAASSASNLLTSLENVGVDKEGMISVIEIAESKDIKVQRAAFVRVTAQVEKLMSDAIASGAIYKQYCPMAFNNNGAYWLSESKEIRNPYFGDVMLKCGRVDATIE